MGGVKEMGGRVQAKSCRTQEAPQEALQPASGVGVYRSEFSCLCSRFRAWGCRGWVVGFGVQGCRVGVKGRGSGVCLH